MAGDNEVSPTFPFFGFRKENGDKSQIERCTHSTILLTTLQVHYVLYIGHVYTALASEKHTLTLWDAQDPQAFNIMSLLIAPLLLVRLFLSSLPSLQGSKSSRLLLPLPLNALSNWGYDSSGSTDRTVGHLIKDCTRFLQTENYSPSVEKWVRLWFTCSWGVGYSTPTSLQTVW